MEELHDPAALSGGLELHAAGGVLRDGVLPCLVGVDQEVGGLLVSDGVYSPVVTPAERGEAGRCVRHQCVGGGRMRQQWYAE